MDYMLKKRESKTMSRVETRHCENAATARDEGELISGHDEMHLLIRHLEVERKSLMGKLANSQGRIGRLTQETRELTKCLDGAERRERQTWSDDLDTALWDAEVARVEYGKLKRETEDRGESGACLERENVRLRLVVEALEEELEKCRGNAAMVELSFTKSALVSAKVFCNEIMSEMRDCRGKGGSRS